MQGFSRFFSILHQHPSEQLPYAHTIISSKAHYRLTTLGLMVHAVSPTGKTYFPRREIQFPYVGNFLHI